MENKWHETILPRELLVLLIPLYKKGKIFLMASIFQFILIANQTQAQSIDIPQNEFSVYASSGSKSKIGISSCVLERIAVRFDSKRGLIERSNVQITVAGNMPAGFYNLIFNCSRHYRAKGTVVENCCSVAPI